MTLSVPKLVTRSGVLVDVGQISPALLVLNAMRPCCNESLSTWHQVL